MATTISGGSYRGVNGVLHNAYGEPVGTAVVMPVPVDVQTGPVDEFAAPSEPVVDSEDIAKITGKKNKNK